MQELTTSGVLVTRPLHYATVVSSEEMTWRAKAYLGIGSARHLSIAFCMIAFPQTFQGIGFKALFEIAPRWFWIISLLIGGVHLAYSAIRRSEGHARTALTISASVSFMWATAFGLVVLDGAASMLATVIFCALGLKDLVVCAQPLRSPFERLVDLYEEPRQRPGT